jgi:hypothetical protein
MKTIDQIEQEAAAIRDDIIAIVEMFEGVGQRFTQLRADIHQLAQLPPRENGHTPAALPPGRIRSGPFARQPREVTDQQVRKALTELGDWMSASELADLRCNGTREHFMYLRATFQKSMRNGLTDGIYEVRKHTGTIERFGIGFVEQYRSVET